MRQIVIDTETTGLEPEKGHRIIELGCIELVDRKLTGNVFHKYINPGHEIGEDALKDISKIVHGITNDFLRDKPTFADIIDEFLEFINGAELIAHNASFDVGFINHEIRFVAKDRKLLSNYVTVFDTLALARKKFPGQRNTLDAICKRYKIDLGERKLQGHGALLDAQLLVKAYLLMTGGQSSLFTSDDFATIDIYPQVTTNQDGKINQKSTIVIYADGAELAAHHVLLATIKKISGKCQWERK
jgi:DNA polymerase-3 subunit epsilon